MHVAVISGDGIGVEVTAEAVKVLEAVGDAFGRRVTFDHLPWGAEHYLRTGETVPVNGYARLAEADAVLVGALGDPRVPDHRHARDILLGTRAVLDLYVNYRPIRLLDERLCPLKGRTTAEIDFVVFRENTEGMYAGVGGRFKADTEDEIAIQEDVNTFKGVHRIISHAFEYARTRPRRLLCMVDKSNAMPHAGGLWQRVFADLARQYPDVQSRHLYVDALTLLLVQDPAQFDVIVTNNLFGDIITDLGAALQGGLGLSASANLHPGRTSMFEPVHGSAPALAGKNVANPMGAVLSVGLMLECLGLAEEARAIETAVRCAVVERCGTPDVGGTLGTRETGDWIAREVRSQKLEVRS